VATIGGSDTGPAAGIELAWKLLSPERTGVVLVETAPDPVPAEIGALAGFGAVAPDHVVQVSAYVFNEWGAGHEQAEALVARAGGGGRRVRTVVNGRLLLLATAGREDPDGFVLNDVCSAFAGRE
jgi:hypothetical protein